MLPRNPAAMADAFCDAPNIFDSINKAGRNVEDRITKKGWHTREDPNRQGYWQHLTIWS